MRPAALPRGCGGLESVARVAAATQHPAEQRGARRAMRVNVDFDRCESNAVCMGVVPEVFEVREDDFLYVLQEEPPEDLRAEVEEAARMCPKQAITIEG